MSLSRSQREYLDWALQAEIQDKPKFQEGLERYLADNEYDYCYFSFYRPLNWIGNVGIVVQSTNPGRDYLYTREPLDSIRIHTWQLVPANKAAKERLREAL
jgi:hypothetical protein